MYPENESQAFATIIDYISMHVPVQDAEAYQQKFVQNNYSLATIYKAIQDEISETLGVGLHNLGSLTDSPDNIEPMPTTPSEAFLIARSTMLANIVLYEPGSRDYNCVQSIERKLEHAEELLANMKASENVAKAFAREVSICFIHDALGELSSSFPRQTDHSKSKSDMRNASTLAEYMDNNHIMLPVYKDTLGGIMSTYTNSNNFDGLNQLAVADYMMMSNDPDVEIGGQLRDDLKEKWEENQKAADAAKNAPLFPPQLNN